MQHEDEWVLAGPCKTCGALLIVDKTGAEEPHDEMFQVAVDQKPYCPIRYQGKDAQPHAPGCYIHIDDWN